MKPLFRKIPHSFGLLLAFFVFILSCSLSLLAGKTAIPPETVLDALFHYDATITEHVIVASSRLARTVIAAVVGASLAVSGALMQALTKNPLAAPDIFGINAGALFFIVCAATIFSVQSLIHYMWVGFLGASLAAAFVYTLGSIGRDGLSPVKLTLAGAAITALFVSFTQGLLVINEQGLQSVLFWLAGSVAGRSLNMLLPILPFMLGACLIALCLGRSINILLTGEDVAKGLGQRTLLTKLVIGCIIVFLAGGSVAVAGSIGFIGLIIPHIVRGLFGTDYRLVIPYSAFLGGSLLLIADIAARTVIMPREMPIGVMTALVGTPFFIYIARRGLARK